MQAYQQMCKRAVSSSPQHILLLGGTQEARKLAHEFSKRGLSFTTSLAGRTREPAPLPGHFRSGGFGGVEGLSRYLITKGVSLVVDATHPFATQISENVRKACGLTERPLLHLNRPPWKSEPGDLWHEVRSIQEAVDALPSGVRVLLALGWQFIKAFTPRRDCFFLLRMVGAPPEELDFESYHIVFGLPAKGWQEEAVLLIKHSVTHIVCRNSGGKGAQEKLRAARELGLPLIMIERPPYSANPGYPSVESLLCALAL